MVYMTCFTLKAKNIHAVSLLYLFDGIYPIAVFIS